MNRPMLQRLIHADFENLLDLLTTRQHLAPHEPVAQTLERSVNDIGVCPNAAAQALQRLQLDGTTAIGRLRRTELMQLARTVHRYWRENADAQAANS
jgi:hypothetical protein